MSAPPDSSVADLLFADFGRVVWRGNRAAAARLAKRCGAATTRSAAGLHIHASTTHHTLTAALAEAVPSLVAALPERQWAELAASFIVQHPPRRPALLHWGNEMPQFLAVRGAKADVIGLAQLDRAALTAFFAVEAEPITTAALGAIAPSDIPHIRMSIHPSLQRLHVSAAATKKWLETKAIPQVDHRRENQADGARIVILRPQAQIRALSLTLATDVFVGALLTGVGLIEACEIAMNSDGNFDFQSVLAALFADGMFVDCVAIGDKE